MESFTQKTTPITMICSGCGHIVQGKAAANITTDLPLMAFDVRLIAECPKCGDMCTECGDDIAMALSILIEKNYNVVKHNQCEWGENLYDPYIKIRTGMNRLTPPDGWEDVTDPAVHSFQVFAPSGSYGTASSDEEIEKYAVQTMFDSQGEFLSARQRYLDTLLNWAIKLPQNTDLTTLKSLKSNFGANNDD
jgi:hypothetical protein